MGNDISSATTAQIIEQKEYSVRERIVYGGYEEDIVCAIMEYVKLQLTLLKGNTIEVSAIPVPITEMLENAIKHINDEYSVLLKNTLALTPDATEEEVKTATERVNAKFIKSLDLSFLNDFKNIVALTKIENNKRTAYKYPREHISVVYTTILKFILDNMYINQQIKYNYVQTLIVMYLCGLFDEYDEMNYVPELKLNITPDTLLSVKYSEEEYKNKLELITNISIEDDVIKFNCSDESVLRVNLRNIGEYYREAVQDGILTNEMLIGRGLRTVAGTIALLCNGGDKYADVLKFTMNPSDLDIDGRYRGLMNVLFSVYLNIALINRDNIGEIIEEKPENSSELLKEMRNNTTNVGTVQEPTEFQRIVIDSDGNIVDFRNEHELPPPVPPPPAQEEEDVNDEPEETEDVNDDQKEEEQKEPDELVQELGFIDKMKHKWNALDKNKQSYIVIGAVVVLMLVVLFFVWLCTRNDENDYDEEVYDENGELIENGYDETNYDENGYIGEVYDETNYDENDFIPEQYVEETNYDENGYVEEYMDQSQMIEEPAVQEQSVYQSFN